MSEEKDIQEEIQEKPELTQDISKAEDDATSEAIHKSEDEATPQDEAKLEDEVETETVHKPEDEVNLEDEATLQDEAKSEDKVKPKEESYPENISKLDEEPRASVSYIDISTHPDISTLSKKKKFVWTRKKKIIAGVIVALICIASVVFAAVFSLLNTSFDDEDESIKEELSTTSFDEPFYMLLIGTDTREGDTYSLEDGRSDSCILVRIDPIKFIVTMISIPRDTKITVNGYTEKFNAEYAAGGISATIAQVKKMMNVEISHYAEISFNGLIDMVDAVGGVEVTVPEEIDDDQTQVYVPAGTNILNGEQALSFARSRKFGDGDFTRTADQRVLIEALINKAYKMDLADLPNVLRAAKNFVKTDLRLGDMLGLATQFKTAEQMTLYSAMVPSTTSGESGVSYVITDKPALRRMMKLVEAGENPLFTQVDSGAQICSSRDSKNLIEMQEAHYKEHPDCPGKISNDSGSYDDDYYEEYSSSNTYYEYEPSKDYQY